MAFSAKKSVFMKEYHRAVFCPPHCSWSTSMISSPLYQRGSKTHYIHADDLAIWNASEHTTTATYRIQEAISDISKWTQDWGLEINTSKTNSTLFSLSTSKEEIKLRLKGEIMPQTDNPTFLGVKLDTTYLEATDRKDGEKQSVETSPDEKARRNFLGCRLINSDQSLHSNSMTNHGVCIYYMGNGCQDQQEQARQNPEHGCTSHTWSHENHPSA